MQETLEIQVLSQGRGDPLEKDMATPLQYSCLENPVDRGAWQATSHGVAQSLIRLSTQTHYTFMHTYYAYYIFILTNKSKKKVGLSHIKQMEFECSITSQRVEVLR